MEKKNYFLAKTEENSAKGVEAAATEIVPGIIKYNKNPKANFPVEYQMNPVIDGLAYTVSVFCDKNYNPFDRRENKYLEYQLQFTVGTGENQSYKITNNGLAAFYKLVDEIARMLKVLHEKEGIQRVGFVTSKNNKRENDALSGSRSKKKNVESQRMYLFVRTLRRKFPQLRVSLGSFGVLMYLDSLDTEKLRIRPGETPV